VTASVGEHGGRRRAVTARPYREAMRIGLVGCVKAKAAYARPAAELYTSALFRGRRRYVERTCDRWFVLSAKHGVIEPVELVEPYDETLKTKSRAHRRAWSAMVIDQLEAALGPLGDHTYEIHAGAEYRDFGLLDELRRRGVSIEIPTEGLQIGKQLAFYTGAP
jgi:hypothetical protein